MAVDYMNEIKCRQPIGPYFLCGYSFGGLVAFELARRLAEAGEEVRLVGLFDTLMSPTRWPLRAWLSIACGRIARLAGRGATAAPPTPFRRTPPCPTPPDPTLARAASIEFSAPTRMIRVAANALIASARYRPGRYRGRLTLFTPAQRDARLPSLEAIWRKHADALTVIETAGRHATMLAEPNATATAALLTRSVRPLCEPMRRSS
jgi:thioesterase domain-containing protein